MSSSTAMVSWKEDLAKAADEAAKQEANVGGGGQFFSLRGGRLSLNDAPIPDNQIGVVIVDAIAENVFYRDSFDPDSPAAPACYAFGRTDDAIAPHEACEEPQAIACKDCPHNQWGSADKGKGKACRNRRRLALIPAGEYRNDGSFEIWDNPEAYAKAPIAFLNVAPTSIGLFAQYVKTLVATHKLPPHAFATRIHVAADPKAQFKIQFECLGILSDAVMPTVIERNAEARSLIVSPYPVRDKAPAKPAKKSTKF